MRVAVIGSRSIKAPDIGKYVDGIQMSEMVSGGASGVDHAAAKWAEKNGIPVKMFDPDYMNNGRAATFIRNRALVLYSDLIVAIWDGESRGTKLTIDYAIRMKKDIRVFYVRHSIQDDEI